MFCFSIYYAEKQHKEKFSNAINWILSNYNDLKDLKEESSLSSMNNSLKIEVFESSYIYSFFGKMQANSGSEDNLIINTFYYENFISVIEKDLIRKKIFHSSYSDILKNILNKSK